MLDVLVLRDPRESAAKCSLTPLRGSDGFRFVEYHPERRVDVDGRVLLDPAGELLTRADRGRPLLLVDCSWRRVASLERTLEGEVDRRRLPEFNTAYPRRSKTFVDPAAGLASVEALFIASVVLGEPHPEWLADYRWRDEFLAANATLLEGVKTP